MKKAKITKLGKSAIAALKELEFDTESERKSFEQGALWLLNLGGNRLVYADGVDYQHELGETDGTVYASKEQTLKENPCSEECGIVKCVLVPVEWVQKQDLSYEKVSKGNKKYREKQTASLEIRIQGLLKKLERYIFLKSSGHLMDRINDLEMQVPRKRKRK